MNADFLAVLEFWEREKGINRDVLSGAVQEALLSAAKKAVGPAREFRVAIDQKNGDIKAFAKLIVSEKVISRHDQLSVFDARRMFCRTQFPASTSYLAIGLQSPSIGDRLRER